MPAYPVRGEILTPLAVVGFTLMGTLLVSTLLSLTGIQIALLWMVVIGIAVLAIQIVIKAGHFSVRFRTGFIALFCLTAAVVYGWLLVSGKSCWMSGNRFAGQSLTFYGEISAVESRDDGGSRFLMKDAQITSEDGRVGKADVLFYSDGELTFCGGERAILTGTASEEITMSQLGIGAELVVFRAGYVGEEEPSLFYPLFRWRSRIESIIKTRIHTVWITMIPH